MTYLSDISHLTARLHESNQVANVGVLKVPGLENGKTYYYKLRVRKQWGFDSEWSREIAVTPDADKPSQAPEVLGLLSSGDDHILLFEPVKKATGYHLNLADGKTNHIPTAQNSFFSFEAKPQNVVPTFRLKLVCFSLEEKKE